MDYVHGWSKRIPSYLQEIPKEVLDSDIFQKMYTFAEKL